jgi:hypothetical protein
MIRQLVAWFIRRNIGNHHFRDMVMKALHEGWRESYTEDNDITRHADVVYWMTKNNPYAHPRAFLGQRIPVNVEDYAGAAHDAVIDACKDDRLPHYRNGKPWRTLAQIRKDETWA